MSENVRTDARGGIDLFEVQRWGIGMVIIGWADVVCAIVFTAAMPPANFVFEAGVAIALAWTYNCIRLALKATELRKGEI